MKKSFALIALLLLSCFLTACGQKQEQTTETEKKPAEIMEAMISSQPDLPEMIRVSAADTEFDIYLSNYYRLDHEQVADGSLCYVDGVDASEIAVLVLANEADAGTAEESLSTYIENRAGDFAGYAPQQEALAKSGIVVINGKYAALLICPDTSAAKTAFLNCFSEVAPLEGTSPMSAPATPAETIPDESETDPASDTVTMVPVDTTEPENHDASEPDSSVPDKSDVSSDTTQAPAVPVESEKPLEPVQETDPFYNSAAILKAWSSGDTSALGEVNLNIYNAAKDVIDQNITSSMSDYEKELAIHDWITGWSSFSMSAFSHAPGGEEEYSVNTPYGVLINKSGTCWGYSTTFQLFMDMLGIECITVYGNPNGSGVEHTWNQVKLDDEWYCVDTAWDDPIGGRPGHSYFNLTSDDFRRTGIHYWDESAVPEATGTKYTYGA